MVGVIIVLAVLILLSIFLCFMARVAVRPTVHTLEYEKNYLLGLKVMEGEIIHIENEHTVETFDGEKLWVGFVPGDPENKHYVVMSHGYTSTRYGMYKYAMLWKKLGYNCVIYDNRGHGVNKPSVISFGWNEGRDLMTVIQDTYERYGQDIHIGLHGESMGSGLQLMALKYRPKIDFIINDCGYSELLPVLRWKVQQAFHMPGWLPDLADLFAKLLYGFHFKDIRPIDNLVENEIPICFVHGDADTFTHLWHSQKMYETNKGYKELHIYEGAEHAVCIEANPKRYLEMLESFVAKVYKE